jgi:cell division protein FtsB
MKIFTVLKLKKIYLINIFLTLYVGINLVGGERGLISYFSKKNVEQNLTTSYFDKKKKLQILENKNRLLSETYDLDYIDTLYREKLKFGKKDEILILLR